jgi:hypothetical protein
MILRKIIAFALPSLPTLPGDEGDLYLFEGLAA